MIKFCIFHDFFGVGGFCPNEKSTLSYVYHYRKHSYISSFVFWGILSWGDFVPTTTLPYSMYSNTVNIHIEQHMFWEDFVIRGRGGILSPEGLSSLLQSSIKANFVILGDFVTGGFCPHIYPLCMCTIQFTFILSKSFAWGDFDPGRILSHQVHSSCWRIRS